jgi:hypothetical protein
MKHFVIAGLLAIGLVGCTSTNTQPAYQYVPRPIPTEPQTQPVRMQSFQWKVLTKVELEQTLAELNRNPDPNFVLFALTADGFQALNMNLVEINRFMQEQQQVVLYYREYVEQTSTTIVPVPTPRPTN